jgi:hypothetical protein
MSRSPRSSGALLGGDVVAAAFYQRRRSILKHARRSTGRPKLHRLLASSTKAWIFNRGIFEAHESLEAAWMATRRWANCHSCASVAVAYYQIKRGLRREPRCSACAPVDDPLRYLPGCKRAVSSHRAAHRLSWKLAERINSIRPAQTSRISGALMEYNILFSRLEPGEVSSGKRLASLTP